VAEALNCSIESYNVYTGRRKLMPDTTVRTFLTFSSSRLRGGAFLALQVQSKRCRETNNGISEVASLSVLVEFLVAMAAGCS